MARRWSFRAAASVRKARPTSRRCHVIAVLSQPWQRPCVPSGICRRPCSNTKQPPLLFPSRLRVRPTAFKTPVPAAAVGWQPVAEGGSRAGKPELHSFVPIRVHSWFNVTPAFPFASSREAHVAQTPSPQRQSAGSQLQKADLGLESPSYIHSCPFVSIRGSKSPLRFPSRLRVFA